eukprot:TRINITY_DN3514_c0_g1_i4.p1 TRINITY_DN3514_c0_g1~~TRINITY_DN3514_c0_g1_i4.p1  ORF type:complete len:432 (-),score=88.73 TRINITY_DN3514_c0_g1_i4:330-1625(-)
MCIRDSDWTMHPGRRKRMSWLAAGAGCLLLLLFMTAWSSSRDVTSTRLVAFPGEVGIERSEVVEFHRVMEEEARARMQQGGSFQTRLELVVVMAFAAAQLDKVRSNMALPTKEARHEPCSVGFDSRVDLVFTVPNQRDFDMVKDKMASLLTPKVTQCYRAVYLTHASLSHRESTDYSIGPPCFFHNTLNSSWVLSPNRTGVKYDYMFWAEPDVVGIRQNWLESLYVEAEQMRAQGVWQRGSTQQHNRKIDSETDRWHINGNALYSLQSPGFRSFLRQARKYNPAGVTAFDYALFNWRAPRGREAYAAIAQLVAPKFQYTESIQNHPADLCPGLGSFTKRHPAALLAHGNEVLRLIAGSGCCELFADDAFLETRLATELSPAYRCFQDEMRAGWLVHGENPGAGRASVSATEQPSYLLRVPLEVPMLSLKVP